MSVVTYHAMPEWIPGGFLGVDIFFVISGFLITGLLLQEMESTGRLSIVGFYERRIRRIAPALYVVMAVTLALALYLFPPSDLMDVGKSLLSSLAFSSNVYFWQTSSYFDTRNEIKPLLHTWSLSVEEQFYVFFPLLLWLVRKYAKRWMLPLLSLACLASLAAAQWAVHWKPVAAFYLLPTRAFELLAGSVLACLMLEPAPKRWLENHVSAAWLNTATLTGFVLLMAPLWLMGNSTTHPGVWTLLPCIGTALILACGDRSILGRWLSWKPVMLIGLMSFSIYLWHQPVFAFTRFVSIKAPVAWQWLLLILIVLLLSAISWCWVEQPIRRQKAVSQRAIFSTYALLTAVLLSMVALVWLSKGFPQRLNADDLQLVGMYDEAVARSERCSASKTRAFKPDALCELGDRSDAVKPTVLLYGDSHADAMASGVDEYLALHHRKGIQATYLGCPAVKGVEREDDSYRCKAFNQFVLSYLKSHAEITHVVIASRWAVLTKQSAFDNQEGGREPPVFPKFSGDIQGDSLIGNAVSLVKDVIAMGKTVILVYPVPEVGWNVPMTLYKLNHIHGYGNLAQERRDINTSFAQYLTRNREVLQAFDQLDSSRLVRIKPAALWCNTVLQGRCVASINGSPLYWDDDHVSPLGAQMIFQSLPEHVI